MTRGPTGPTRVEVEAPPPPPPIDPVALVPEEVEAVALVRSRNLRGTPIVPAIDAWLRSEELLASLEAGGIDPLADIDLLVIAGRTGSERPDVVVIEHHVEEPRLLRAFDHLAGPSGSRTEERAGHRIAAAQAGPARLVLASATIAVLTTDERLAEIERRLDARSPRSEIALRLDGLGRRAPDLAGSAGILAASGPPSRWRDGPGQLGMPRPDGVEGLVSLAGGAAFFIRAGYESEEEAAQCEQAARTFLSGTSPATLLFRLMGLGRALREARIERQGKEVLLRARLEPDEIGRLVDRLFPADARRGPP